MGKLKMLGSAITPLRSSVAFVPQGAREYDRFRNQQAWRKWYKTARWRWKREATLLRDAFTCTMCGRVGQSRDLVADHVQPHRGDERLFWEGALTTLCASPCHSKHKQRAEQGR